MALYKKEDKELRKHINHLEASYKRIIPGVLAETTEKREKAPPP
jgi:hypothetical protein